MEWIVDRRAVTVARLVGASIVSTSPEGNVLGFILGNRVYSWMGVPVGNRTGCLLTDLSGRLVARISRDATSGACCSHEGAEPTWSRFGWDRYLPEPHGSYTREPILISMI